MLNAPNTPSPPPVGVTLVSPPEPQPGPISTVGAGCAALAPATGNQCSRMRVPSNDTIVLSLADPATGVTVGGAATGRLHGCPPEPVIDVDAAVARVDGVVEPVPLFAGVELEHAAASTVATSAPVIRRPRPIAL